MRKRDAFNYALLATGLLAMLLSFPDLRGIGYFLLAIIAVLLR